MSEVRVPLCMYVLMPLGEIFTQGNAWWTCLLSSVMIALVSRRIRLKFLSKSIYMRLLTTSRMYPRTSGGGALQSEIP